MMMFAKAAESTHAGRDAKRVLGIEGGGTKTEWILAECAESESPAILRHGWLSSANLKLNTDEQLVELFSVLPRDVTHVGAYLAGCRTEEDHERLRGVVTSVWPRATIAVGSDRDSAMAAAFRDGDGIIVIAGTGAVVHGRCGGRTERAGGWGQLLGDRGGGYHVAMQGVRSVLTHCDLNDEISPLAQEILRMLALNHLNDLIDWASQADKMSIARLAPAVFEAARRGDPEIQAIVRNGAEILAGFTNAVAQRLEFPDPPVRLFGGLFAHYPEYVAQFREGLRKLLPQAEVEVSHDSGALGAVWLAGCRCCRKARSRRRQSAERAPSGTGRGRRGGTSAAHAARRTRRGGDRAAQSAIRGPRSCSRLPSWSIFS